MNINSQHTRQEAVREFMYEVNSRKQWAEEIAECTYPLISNRVLGVALATIGAGAFYVSLTASLTFTATLILGTGSLITVVYGLFLFAVSYDRYRHAYPSIQASQEMLKGNYEKAIQHLEYYIDKTQAPNFEDYAIFKFQNDGYLGGDACFRCTFYGFYTCSQLLLLRSKGLEFQNANLSPDGPFIEKFNSLKQLSEETVKRLSRKNGSMDLINHLIRDIESYIGGNQDAIKSPLPGLANYHS